MKVKILYILSFGDWVDGGADEEADKVAAGLYGKHSEKCAAIGVVAVKGDQCSLVNRHLKGPLPLRAEVGGNSVDARKAADLVEEIRARKFPPLSSPKIAASPIPAAAQVPQPSSPSLSDKESAKQVDVPSERLAGAYVIMHGPDVLAPPVADLAKALDSVLPELVKPLLHYVVLLSCNLAEKKADKPGLYDLDRKDAPYIQQFMKALHDRKMTPAVAGWDEFITAAPYKPYNRPVVDGKGGQIDVTQVQGQKIVRMNYPGQPVRGLAEADYRLVDNEYRKKHKHVFRIKDGRISVALGTWSTTS